MSRPRRPASASSPRYTPATPPSTRPCDREGCPLCGEYRAPRSRNHLREYYWFCLDHVREYNAAWDFYAGMTIDEIEVELQRDSTWQRPTWPMGQWSAEKAVFEKLDRDFGFGGATKPRAPVDRTPRTEEERALRLFDLSPPVTFAQIKARYRELVKQHHPDANGGDKDAEERLKSITIAYSLLRSSYQDVAKETS